MAHRILRYWFSSSLRPNGQELKIIERTDKSIDERLLHHHNPRFKQGNGNGNEQSGKGCYIIRRSIAIKNCDTTNIFVIFIDIMQLIHYLYLRDGVFFPLSWFFACSMFFI